MVFVPKKGNEWYDYDSFFNKSSLKSDSSLNEMLNIAC
jgi:hypothetical protein